MDARDAGAEAAERADAAGRRTKEIADRLTRLATGERTAVADVQVAQERAEEARLRARESVDRARLGHERAARSHERTAEAHDQAARRGVGDAADHTRLAEQHRRDAAADHAEALLHIQPDVPTSEGDAEAPSAEAAP
jgi:hypothetical protein